MKRFTVWIEVAEYDEKTGESWAHDVPGADAAEFDTEEQAWDFAIRLAEAAGELARANSTLSA